MADLAARIRAALDEYDRDRDREELDERLSKIEQSAGRAFTKDDLKAIMSTLDDSDRDELVEALVGPERFARMRDEPAVDDGGDDVDDDADDDPDAPKPKKTRPGRTPGMAYDWDVDDEGNVIDLDMARVYSGDPEPDEVELPQAANE